MQIHNLSVDFSRFNRDDILAVRKVKLTPAGSTWPYHKDPHDNNIRIAPTYPTLDDLRIAAELFTLCVRLVSAEKIYKEMKD